MRRLIRPCVLELGGKSAAIVLEDARIEDVIPVLVGASVGGNAGQSCVALTRLVVPASQYDQYAEALVEAFRSLKVGDPMETDTVVGPLVTERQRARVEAYVELARRRARPSPPADNGPRTWRRVVLRADADHQRPQRHESPAKRSSAPSRP